MVAELIIVLIVHLYSTAIATTLWRTAAAAKGWPVCRSWQTQESVDGTTLPPGNNLFFSFGFISSAISGSSQRSI
jgi:hypothetical protein